MLLPNLPSRNGGNIKQFEIELNDELLSNEEYQLIINNKGHDIKINYEGSQRVLNMLMQQLSQIRTNSIILTINKCLIDYNLCLPFDELNNKTELRFFDSPNAGSGFNDYLMNCNDFILKQALRRLNTEDRERISAEIKYRNEILAFIHEELEKRNININNWTNKQKMDFFFSIIDKNYPYDHSITNPDGSWDYQRSTQLGGTAKVVYEREKGICEGRSKLLKVVTNNKDIKLPCYLVFGKLGRNGHVWNEFIDENGNIFEYDLSTKVKCSLDDMEKFHSAFKEMKHEVPVERILRKSR